MHVQCIPLHRWCNLFIIKLGFMRSDYVEEEGYNSWLCILPTTNRRTEGDGRTHLHRNVNESIISTINRYIQPCIFDHVIVANKKSLKTPFFRQKTRSLLWGTLLILVTTCYKNQCSSSSKFTMQSSVSTFYVCGFYQEVTNPRL